MSARKVPHGLAPRLTIMRWHGERARKDHDVEYESSNDPRAAARIATARAKAGWTVEVFARQAATRSHMGGEIHSLMGCKPARGRRGAIATCKVKASWFKQALRSAR